MMLAGVECISYVRFGNVFSADGFSWLLGIQTLFKAYTELN